MAQNLVPFEETGRTGWHVRWRESNGKRHRRQFARRQDAWAFARKKQRELELGRPQVSLTDLFDRYLAVNQGAESTRQSLRWRLNKALAAFQTVPVQMLTTEEIERWRLTMAEGHQFETVQALKQALRWAGKAGLIERHHPALDAKNPQPSRTEIRPFTWEEIELLASVIDPRYSALIIFAAATGLRPAEWVALEWRDIDLTGTTPTVTVCRRLTKDGKIVPETKNKTHRRVPLVPNAVKALRSLPRWFDTRLVFPAPEGGVLDLHNWRERRWQPAMLAAGFADKEGRPDRGPYALRHTFATRALRAGLSTFAVARRMGTSVQMIERSYGHLAPDAAEHELALLTALDGPQVAPTEKANDAL